jgi:serine/threonine protein kinase
MNTPVSRRTSPSAEGRSNPKIQNNRARGRPPRAPVGFRTNKKPLPDASTRFFNNSNFQKSSPDRGIRSYHRPPSPNRNIPSPPIKDISSPSRNIPSPKKDIPSPSNRNNPSPVKNNPSPVRNNPSPVRNNPSPVRNNPSPPTKNKPQQKSTRPPVSRDSIMAFTPVSPMSSDLKKLSHGEIKETSTLRYSDGVRYMRPADFFDQFKMESRYFGKGGFGKVYRCGTKYVVKEFEEIISTRDFANELNAYASIIHPCIMKPKAFTIKGNRGYIAMRRGQDIIDAFKQKKVTIEQIISDVLSAVAFLNENNLVHGDIKPYNMIFLKGRTVLIDLGKCRRVKVNTDGKKYIVGPSYTANYKDPEYSDYQLCNIKCEVYSIAISVQHILTDLLPEFGGLYVYNSGIPHVDWFLKQAKEPASDNLNISYFLEADTPEARKLIVTRYTGTVLKDSPLFGRSKPDKNLKMLMGWLIAVGWKYKFEVEAIFLAFHLIHRLYARIMAKYEYDKDIIQLFGCVCMNLAMNNCTTEGGFNIKDWRFLSDLEKEISLDTYQAQYMNMTAHVLAYSNGIISTMTYWDYAESGEDLPALLYDVVKGDYNPKLIRKAGSRTSKCVTLDEILSKDEKEKYYNIDRDLNLDFGYDIPRVPLEDEVTSCVLNIECDFRKLVDMWNTTKWRSTDVDISLPIVLRNREVLRDLLPSAGMTIFRYLMNLQENKKFAGLAEFILDNCCQFDWVNDGNTILKQNVNPFSIVRR